MGRLQGVRSADAELCPRFVFARTRGGCLWRFREDLPVEVVTRLARLAAREPGAAADSSAGQAEPERLVMMIRCLDPDRERAPRHRRFELEAGLMVDEWLFD